MKYEPTKELTISPMHNSKQILLDMNHEIKIFPITIQKSIAVYQ